MAISSPAVHSALEGNAAQRGHLQVPEQMARPQRHETRASNNSDMKKKALATRSGFKRPSLWVLVFGWFLAMCAGFVNAVAFRSLGLYVSHVTGSTTAIGLRIEGVHSGEQQVEDLTEAVSLVFSFLLGAFACGLLIDKNTVHFLGKAFYGVALVGNSMLLVVATFMPATYPLVAACFAAAACGLQNAMCTSHFGAVVRTTHVTGTVTDIGSTLGRMAMIYLRKGCRRSQLNVLELAEVGVDARKLLVLGPMWLSLLLGCIFGAYFEHAWGRYALLVPAAFTFLVGASYSLFRSTLKEYIKGLEKDRLNQDFHDVQEGLARAKGRLNSHTSPTSSHAESASVADDSMVAELEREMSHMIHALQEVEADMENLGYDAAEVRTNDVPTRSVDSVVVQHRV